MLPFPIRKNTEIFTFVLPVKDYIFVDALKRQFGKMSDSKLTNCFQPNLLHRVCKADIPISTYIPDEDCEMTLIHPSSIKLPESCEISYKNHKNLLDSITF